MKCPFKPRKNIYDLPIQAINGGIKCSSKNIFNAQLPCVIKKFKGVISHRQSIDPSSISFYETYTREREREGHLHNFT